MEKDPSGSLQDEGGLQEDRDQPVQGPALRVGNNNEGKSIIAEKGEKFEPLDVKGGGMIDSGLPPELWTIVQSAHANFTPQYFLEVSRNLLENPNLTASHLSRAEISYSSFTDASFNPSAQHPHDLAKIIKHLKPSHQPLLVPGGVPRYHLEWTVVRKLIPRNPKLDEPLLQTCHLYTSTSPVYTTDQHGSSNTLPAERYLVIYIPHVTSPDDIPFYHPKVRSLAILYAYQPSVSPAGTLSIYYNLFPEKPLDNRLERTALKMLEIIHKHSKGRMAGYQKRVHHDVIIAQKPFQDTYTYLKGKYCKQLIENWVEQTPAEKHVFEDLGIAAFLIELWTDMYGDKGAGSPEPASELHIEVLSIDAEQNKDQQEKKRREEAQQAFPGFVDIGCGNGLLVWILNQEGWKGWGFDARRRKTWSTFAPEIQENLKEMLLIPEVLVGCESEGENDAAASDVPAHNGMFPRGTFIVSNHADELTVWTPILAFLNESPFIAIPCCSHNFGGTRFRAPFKAEHSFSNSSSSTSNKNGKQPSAYASLCSYLAYITDAAGYKAEKEHLRIPTTRNIGIIGRKRKEGAQGEMIESLEDKMKLVRAIVEKEMPDCDIEQVRLQWLKRGSGLVKEKGGH
jgi:tRNASer (uridine44-2'-O)-methyltransferase